MKFGAGEGMPGTEGQSSRGPRPSQFTWDVAGARGGGLAVRGPGGRGDPLGAYVRGPDVAPRPPLPPPGHTPYSRQQGEGLRWLREGHLSSALPECKAPTKGLSIRSGQCFLRQLLLPRLEP